MSSPTQKKRRLLGNSSETWRYNSSYCHINKDTGKPWSSALSFPLQYMKGCHNGTVGHLPERHKYWKMTKFPVWLTQPTRADWFTGTRWCITVAVVCINPIKIREWNEIFWTLRTSDPLHSWHWLGWCLPKDRCWPCPPCNILHVLYSFIVLCLAQCLGENWYSL